MKPLMITCMLAASPALAICPVADDLNTGGILALEDNGTRHVFRSIGNSVVAAEAETVEGSQYRDLLAHGFHILQMADIVDGTIDADSIVNIAFPSAAQDLPVPEENGSWSVKTAITDTFGFYVEEQSHSWGQKITLTIAECTYDVIPAKVTLRDDLDIEITEGIYYFPDLGISLVHSYLEETFSENYSYIGIEALR